MNRTGFLGWIFVVIILNQLSKLRKEYLRMYTFCEFYLINSEQYVNWVSWIGKKKVVKKSACSLYIHTYTPVSIYLSFHSSQALLCNHAITDTTHTRRETTPWRHHQSLGFVKSWGIGLRIRLVASLGLDLCEPERKGSDFRIGALHGLYFVGEWGIFSSDFSLFSSLIRLFYLCRWIKFAMCLSFCLIFFFL